MPKLENPADSPAKVTLMQRIAPKGLLRFALGIAEGNHPSSWAMWGHKSDFYLGARSVLGSIKISLHKTECRVAFLAAAGRSILWA